MSFGIEIINKYGSTIINDTSQNYLPTSSVYGTVAAGVSYATNPGIVNSRDLVFAAPAVNQSKAIGITYDNKWNNVGNPATSYRYVVLKRADLFTAGSGYGLQVFDSGSDLCFDSTVNANFKILAVTNVQSNQIEQVTLPTPSSTFSNFQNVFVLTNNLVATNNSSMVVQYNWVTSTTGRISFTSFAFTRIRAIIIEVLK